ncbi:hypothetical protein PIROE2DRAFT_17532 [Piromyces sp. E2]|nr:hypothetical protein PIROE2DRAFT_17532 [Piromyces sp. E2]|eukprot:OUM57471.1 hypothetical protein PIROE2DRAFT_17532 [Piromyces sp. E2]
MTDSAISLVINFALKKITGIQNDNTLEKLMDIITSDNLSNLSSLGQKYPEFDFNKLKNSFNKSEYANYDFGKNLKFKKEDDIVQELNYYFLMFGVIAIVSFICSFIYYTFLDISALYQATRIRSLVFKSIMKQDIPWHEKTSAGELSSRIIGDTILIEDGIGSKIGMLIQNISTFVAAMIVAFISGWKLTLYMSALFVLVTVVVSALSIVLAKTTENAQNSYATAGGIAQETFSQIRTIVSFGNEQKEIDRYTKELIPSYKMGIKKSHILGICLGLFFGIAYFSYSIAFIIGGKLIYSGEIVAGDVLKVLMGVMFGAQSFGMSSSSITAMSSAIGSASVLFHVIERESKIRKDIGEHPEQPLKGNIEFRNVHFTYPSRPDVEVLKGISFKCEPGQTIALVGASGSGKSTVVQLLERFYEKSEGDIFIDGKTIEDFNISWLRSQIGLVSQEPTLFDTTIAENISISCPSATQKQIETAAKLANAHEFISKLSNGYQTSTGEKGLQLSGGQKQRICIARALLMNPKILLLDEATSALDNQSEKIVQKALDSASSGRTTLVIAHRLTTIKNADRIIVMDKGVIIESGTHEELIAKQDVYYNLVKNQEINVKENNVTEEDTSSFDENPEEEYREEGLDHYISQESTLLDKRLSTRLSIQSNYSGGVIERHSTVGSVAISDEKVKRSVDRHRYLSYNKPIWFRNSLGIIGSIFNGSMQPLCAFIYASAINSFNKQGQEMLDSTKFWGLMFMVLALANFLCVYFKQYGFSSAGEYLSFIFRKEMYNNIIRQEIGFFDTCDVSKKKTKKKTTKTDSKDSKANTSTGTGTLTAKLSTETSLVQGLNINFGTLIEILIGIVVCYSIAFYYSVKLTLILLAFTPFLFAGVLIQMKAMLDKNEEKRRIFENSTKIAVEAIVGIKTVNALNIEERFCRLYDEKLIEPRNCLKRAHIKTGLGVGFGNCMIFLSYGIGYYFGFLFFRKGQLDFEGTFKVCMAVIFTSLTIGQAGTAGPDMVKSANAFSRILEIIDRKSKINASDLSFNNIRFRYPSRPDITVLRLGNDKIEVPENKMLAIVGGSGCGKSTIVGLLPRWYDPQHGEILVDGEKNTNYNLKYLREHIGIVNQEPSLFNISIRENIRYGYDTLVGGTGTSQMSGGQKQRIAIARAIIQDASQGRTTITIAHRLSTIKNADVIIVMRNGRIIEKGNHHELMAKKGEYYEMVLAGDGV